ncbi:MerR family transcriptional regulator [Streptomyces sp. NPDC002666]
MEYLLPPRGLLTTKLAALNCGVQPATIRDWVRRGILTPCGGTPKRPVYRLADVEAARSAAKPTRNGQRGVNAA